MVQLRHDRDVNPAKVVFLTNLTSCFSLPVLESVASTPELELVHVLFYDTVAANKGRLRRILREHGWKLTLGKVCDVVRCKIRISLSRRFGSGRVGALNFSHEYAVANRIPFSIIRSANARSVVALLEQLQPDLLLVCSCSHILKKGPLSIPKFGSINIHLSLLPKYRGPAPAFWALYNGESETGVTFHVMNEGIDEGDMIAQFSVPIGNCRCEKELTERLFKEASARVTTVLSDFVQGRITPRLQERQLATCQTYPTRQQRLILSKM